MRREIAKLVEVQLTPGTLSVSMRNWTFKPSETVIAKNVKVMHEFSATMDNGTEISGRFPNKAALRDALEMLMNELEYMP